MELKKITIIDPEKKRTFVVREGSLPDADLVNSHISFASYYNWLLPLKQYKNEVHEVSYILRYSCLESLDRKNKGLFFVQFSNLFYSLIFYYT